MSHLPNRRAEQPAPGTAVGSGSGKAGGGKVGGTPGRWASRTADGSWQAGPPAAEACGMEVEDVPQTGADIRAEQQQGAAEPAAMPQPDGTGDMPAEAAAAEVATSSDGQPTSSKVSVLHFGRRHAGACKHRSMCCLCTGWMEAACAHTAAPACSQFCLQLGTPATHGQVLHTF